LRIKTVDELPPHLRSQAQAAVDGPTKAAKAAKPQKFGNQVVEQDGARFDSKWELQRWNELRQQESAGLITDLRRQQEYPLHARTPAGDMVRIGCYVADMDYLREGRRVIEDAKSSHTRRHPLFRWKAVHLEAEYGVRLIEVTKVRRRRGSREGER
jgi:hypothetical protein